MSIVDVRPTVEAPDDDPYLWLEERESPQALAWVEAQNSATMKRFFDSRFAADRDALKLVFDRPDNIPFPNRRGKKLFNPWQDAEHPRGLWRTTSLESFRSEDPKWDVLIDLDALAASEGEDWVWCGELSLPGTHDRAIVHLSRGGKDAVVLREFNLTTREFVADGFNLPEARSQVAWLDRDTLLLMSPLGRLFGDLGPARQGCPRGTDMVSGEAWSDRYQLLDWRPRRGQSQDRGSCGCQHMDARRLACREAADGLVHRRADV
jgi:prolyl oligopeptidase